MKNKRNRPLKRSYDNFFFRDGLTVDGRVDAENFDYVPLRNLKVVGVNHRAFIFSATYKGQIYYTTYNALMSTFLFPECVDRDKDISQNHLWSPNPPICL